MPKFIDNLKAELTKRRFAYFLAVLIIGIVTIGFFVFVFPLVPNQSTESRLPYLAAATSGQKVLFFSPHPDDETIAAGGYIAQSIENGADVRIVLITNGNAQNNEAIRYEEFKTATDILGVPTSSLVFLGLPDGKLESYDQKKLQADLQAQIDLYQPDIVIYPNPQDYNRDHAAIGRAMESLLASGQYKFAKYEYLVHYKLMYPRPYAWKFDPQFYLLPPKDLMKTGEEWLSFTLSQAIENKKEKALLSYHSQFHSAELDGLLHSSIRKNELFSIPQLKNLK